MQPFAFIKDIPDLTLTSFLHKEIFLVWPITNMTDPECCSVCGDDSTASPDWFDRQATSIWIGKVNTNKECLKPIHVS